MTHAPRELLPGWRAGLLVLGLYAMLLQAFFGALTGPSHALPGPGGEVLCVSGQASAADEAPSPAMPHKERDCGCAALCHMAGALAGAVAAPVPTAPFAIVLSALIVDDPASSRYACALPPARAPPRAGFDLPV